MRIVYGTGLYRYSRPAQKALAGAGDSGGVAARGRHRIVCIQDPVADHGAEPGVRRVLHFQLWDAAFPGDRFSALFCQAVRLPLTDC